MWLVTCLPVLLAISCAAPSSFEPGLADLSTPDSAAGSTIPDAAASDLVATGPQAIVLAAGVVGTMTPGQSYNGENRGVDVTPVARPVTVRKLAVSGLSQVGATGTFFLFDASRHQLASAQATIAAGGVATAALSVPQQLKVGQTYRVTFLQPQGSHGSTGTFFTPMKVPYLEATSLLDVGASWSTLGAACPTSPNIFQPLFLLTVD